LKKSHEILIKNMIKQPGQFGFGTSRSLLVAAGTADKTQEIFFNDFYKPFHSYKTPSYF
jgi:hypothetical protein